MTSQILTNFSSGSILSFKSTLTGSILHSFQYVDYIPTHIGVVFSSSSFVTSLTMLLLVIFIFGTLFYYRK